jgi:hypothetical protein
MTFSDGFAVMSTAKTKGPNMYIDWHEAKDVGLSVVVGCSVAHTFLPPWDADAIKAFPRFQKVYRLVIYFLGYVAINFRSTVYKSISIYNPNGLNSDAQADPRADQK